ncbi:mitochondrial glutamate carrier 1 isoform X2 [Drosophila eugracilis]|uniref:mitochondrial glutamate carrier 1 isoform X2 n=1 Tax=Drosophila eugracilis TaxID=29029 RepID=UPI0007E890AE|nr:mitochondrial glutamate carrier 1 isoform X2 [Drosophila eugracilis]
MASACTPACDADCFRKTIASEGFFGMYKGSAVNIILVTPEKSIKLAANDYFRYQLATEQGVLSLPRAGLAGGLAGMFQIVVTTPMELLKIQMQDAGRMAAAAKAEGREFKQVSALGLTKELLRERGILGLYKGVGATGVRDITFSVLYFPLMAIINDKGPRKSDGSGEAVFYWSLIAGLLAGMTGAFTVTPLDVIKTRLQGDIKKEYNGIADCVRKTLKKEGVTAFFKGGLCRIMVVAPLFGIAQMFYFLGVGEQILGIEQKKSV